MSRGKTESETSQRQLPLLVSPRAPSADPGWVVQRNRLGRIPAPGSEGRGNRRKASEPTRAGAPRPKKRLRALVDFFTESPLGMLLVRPDGRIEQANARQLRLLNATAKKVIGRPVGDWFVHPAEVTGLLRQVRNRKPVRNHRTRFRRANGADLHVVIDVDGLWLAGRFQYSRWFVRDITRRIVLEREILRAVENEQARFGQDLHDDLCQQLAGIEFLCQRLARERRLISKTGAARVLEIAALLRESVDHAREMARGLSPVSGNGGSLVAALRGLAERTQAIHRCDCRFRCNRPVEIDSHEVSSHLYRIAQEAVTNAIRHGQARRINLGLTRTGGGIVLSIHDNGVGLPANARKPRGVGLQIMSHRADVIGASLAVQRRRGGGTMVICEVPRGRQRRAGGRS